MEKKKLYRSRTEKMLGGVCGGLADYLEMDVTILRLIAVALIILAGTGILFYLIAWILIPREGINY